MAFTVLIFTRRKPGMSFAEYKDYYENKHMPLGSRLMAQTWPESHTRYYIDLGNKDAFFMGTADGLVHDCISDLKYRDEAHFKAMVATYGDPDVAAQIAADEENVFDRSATKVVIVGQSPSTPRSG